MGIHRLYTYSQNQKKEIKTKSSWPPRRLFGVPTRSGNTQTTIKRTHVDTVKRREVSWLVIFYLKLTMNCLLVQIIALFTITLWNTPADAEMGLEFPVHDGKSRILNLSKKNFDRFIKKSDILVVYFTMPLDESDEKGIRHWELTKQ